MPTLPSRALWCALALVLASACGGGGGSSGSSDTTSTTARREPRDHVRIVAVGDIACEAGKKPTDVECQHKATADLAEFLEPDYVLALGDLQYPHGEIANWADGYGATWGRFNAITRPVPGNHEYDESPGEGYYKYWREADVEVGEPNGWYSFDLPSFGWHVVALNSNCTRGVDCAVGSEQEKWLRADLEASNAQCTLMLMHHPQRASGEHGGTGVVRPFVDALEADRGELVVAAHDHLYERFAAKDGVRHFVAGTGGRSHYGVVEREEGSEFVDTTNFGVLELRLRAGGYAWRFVALGNRVIDEGQEACH